MLTDTGIELRSPAPSVLMRAVKWLIGRRKPVFPHDPAGFHAAMAGRDKPADASMPITFYRDFKVGAMVKYCGISVSVPLYPVVPEASYAEQDAVADAAYAELAAHHDPARIILNGDSAGGHMALTLALRLVRDGGPLPGKLALFAPWLDLGLADPAIAAVEPHDVMLKIGTLRACGEMVAAGRAMDDPAVSPLYAPTQDLAQLPPTRIFTGRHDIFIVDSRSFLAKLRAAGVDAKLYEYEAAPHVFMAITPTREAKDVFGLLGEFIAA